MKSTTSHASLHLSRNPLGRLVLVDARGATHSNVVPVRAFPIGAPDDGIALVSSDGHELLWLDRLDQLPPEMAELVREELASREFIPEIIQLKAVSSFACPSTWEVDTDRGPTRLVLKGEEDIRRLDRERLLIADSHGIQYLVRNLTQLDRHSRRLLDRFL